MDLRTKLVRTMGATLALIATAVLVAVTTLHIYEARRTRALVETKIEESIIRKGHGLVTNQAHALRELVSDNAFGDVRRLVEGTLAEDPEIIYGLFLGADLRAWAYLSPTSTAAGTPQAWRALNLGSALLSPTAVRQERRSLFQQDVFEFAAPVRSDDRTVAGTIIYGLSGVPLAAALARARSEAWRSLLATVALIVLLTGGTALVGLMLVRRAAARISQPVSELTAAAVALAAGQRDVRVSIRSGDELEKLGDTFNQMVTELGDSYAKLEGLNRTLEQRVADRTRALADRNRDLRLVLDTVNEGLLTVSRDGWLSQERSACIDRWFGPFSGQVRLIDYLARVDPLFADALDLSLLALQDGFLPLPLLLDQMPRRLRQGERLFDVSYLTIADASIEQGLLLAFVDVTEQVALLRQEAEQQELLAALQGLTQDRAGFGSFLDEANLIVAALEAPGLDADTRKRLLHTLKGNAAGAGFNLVAQLCHGAEDQIAEREAAGQDTLDVPLLVALRERWATLVRAVNDLAGGRRRQVIEVAVDEIEGVRDALEQGVPAARIRDQLARWQLEPAERPLQRLGERGRLLAARLGKGQINVAVDGGGLRLHPVRWARLWTELTHVVRNAVDHGLEPAADRIAAGKAAPAELRLSAALREHDFVIEIADNGRGIDWSAVRRSADKRGLPSATESDLTAALFVGGLSAAAGVTTTSGRGVGLEAVQARIDEYGGTISVRSTPNQGTAWRFVFPRTLLSPPEGPDPFLQNRRPASHAAA